MIKGRYGDTTGSPFLEGRVFIPSLNLDGNVSFLVDTGADNTVLSFMDAIKLGVDFTKLTDRSVSYGIGGRSEDFLVPARVLFLERDKAIYEYRITLAIPVPIYDPDLESIPSLLGRDVISRWSVSLNFIAKNFAIDVLSYDDKHPVVPKARPTGKRR